MQNNQEDLKIRFALKKLEQKSPAARKLLKKNNLSVITVLPTEGFSKLEEFSFHPTGPCGCFELEDDYFINIRCDHLMWADGWCECTDELVHCDPSDPVLFIFGNHKGMFKAEVIY